MQRRHGSDISAAAQEYLLALRVMGSDGRVATTAQLGRHVGVSTQAASEMCRRLASDGLLEPATGRGLVLTTAGRAAADGIFRRHALLEWLLTSVVGLSWAESDEAAFEAARKWKGAQPEEHYREDWHIPAKMYENGEAQMSDDEFKENAIISSDPSEHVDRIRELEELGATVIVLQNNSGADPLGAIRFYGEHVLPALRGVRA